MTTKESQEHAIHQIQDDLVAQVSLFKEQGKLLEAQRLEERVNYDLEMIRELGHCSGIENYSRYFDGRQPGMRPYCLLDFSRKTFCSSSTRATSACHKSVRCTAATARAKRVWSTTVSDSRPRSTTARSNLRSFANSPTKHLCQRHPRRV